MGPVLFLKFILGLFYLTVFSHNLCVYGGVFHPFANTRGSVW